MLKAAPLIGRIFLSLIFILSGFGKIGDFSVTKQYMASVGMPAVGFFLVMAIIFEIVGGLSVISGFKARWGAIILIIFLIPATLIFHRNIGDQMQMIQVMKNLALIGGLLMVVSFGPGAFSIDNKKA